MNEAAREYQSALGIDQDHVGAHLNLDLACYRWGRLDDAICEWQVVLRVSLGYKNRNS